MLFYCTDCFGDKQITLSAESPHEAIEVCKKQGFVAPIVESDADRRKAEADMLYGVYHGH